MGGQPITITIKSDTILLGLCTFLLGVSLLFLLQARADLLNSLDLINSYCTYTPNSGIWTPGGPHNANQTFQLISD